MIQLTLLELVKKQIPHLNYDDAKDIVKIEKVLKAEAKLNPAVKINDIENLLSFLKLYKGKFLPILQNKNIAIIVGQNTGRINFARLHREHISDDTLFEFQQAFAPNTRDFVKKSVRDGDWTTLRSIFLNYDFLVEEELREEICESFVTKNHALISAIETNQCIAFAKANAFSVEEGYFYLLSTLAPGYFDEDVLRINNAISERQKTDPGTKHYLGKVLYAATFFDAFDESLKSTLQGNQQIALSWVYPNLTEASNNGFFSKVITAVVLVVLGFILFVIALEAGVTYTTPFVLIGVFVVRAIIALNKK